MTKEEYNKVVEFVAKRIHMFDELLDMAYSDQYSSEEILKLFKDHYFEKSWNDFKKELKEHPDHFGDCTGDSAPCLQCCYERYIEEAQEELEKEGIKCLD